MWLQVQWVLPRVWWGMEREGLKMKSARASEWQGNNSTLGHPLTSPSFVGFIMGLATPPIKVLTFGSVSSLCFSPSQLVPTALIQLDSRSTSFSIPTALVQDPMLSCLDHYSSTYLVSPPPASSPPSLHFLHLTAIIFLKQITSKPKTITTGSNMCGTLSSFQAPLYIFLIESLQPI